MLKKTLSLLFSLIFLFCVAGCDLLEERAPVPGDKGYVDPDEAMPFYLVR